MFTKLSFANGSQTHPYCHCKFRGKERGGMSFEWIYEDLEEKNEFELAMLFIMSLIQYEWYFNIIKGKTEMRSRKSVRGNLHSVLFILNFYDANFNMDWSLIGFIIIGCLIRKRCRRLRKKHAGLLLLTWTGGMLRCVYQV